MKIKLSESGFKLLKSLMLDEAVAPNPINIGTKKTNDEYSLYVKTLATIPSLHDDMFKNKQLEESYMDWEKTGFDKNSDEYKVWSANLLSYMNFLKAHFYFLQKKDRRLGDMIFFKVILDDEWVKDLKRNGNSDHECFYTSLLKIYQNKAIWNDLFFNPDFNEILDLYHYFKAKVAKNIMIYKTIIPLEEYKTLNLFERNGDNAKPELFCQKEDEPEEFNWDELS